MWTCAICEASSKGSAVKRAHHCAPYCDWCAGELKRTARAWCGRGRHVVPLAEMASGKGRCRECERERMRKYEASRPDYAKQWREANRERVLAYGAEYRRANRPRLLAYAHARYWKDPEKARAIYRARHARHKDKRSAWRRAQYWTQPELERERTRSRYLARKLAILRGGR